MNWFKGSITEAVTVSKQNNATFVVYIEGKDENSSKLTGFLNKPGIRQKLEDDNFVAVKIEGGTEAYMQFASLYQIVPVPSLFFIGKNGVPLEVATGIIASSEELEKKIDNVLKLTGKVSGGNSSSNSAASASAAFIAGEQRRDAQPSSTTASSSIGAYMEPSTQDDLSSISDLKSTTESKAVEDTTSSKSSLSSIELPTSSDIPESSVVSPPNEDLYCTDTTCFRKPKSVNYADVVDPPSDNTSSLADSISMDTVPAPSVTVPPAPVTPPNDASDTAAVNTSTTDHTPSTPVTTPTTASSPPVHVPVDENPAATADKLEQAKKLIEERRKLREAEEERQARELELNRRKDGKATQGMQKWQKEQDFKELKESIRRDRLEDKAARQRILEQIASDRVERAKKFTTPAPNPTTQATTPNAVNISSNLEVARIQFRIPNGETNTMSFESSDTFATVRAYVKGVVIKGTGIRDFALATTFPKHEFTNDDDTQTLLDLGLAPSAVILIISKCGGSGPSAVVARSGGIINIFNTVFWTIMTPVLSAFGYIRNFIIGRNDDESRPINTGAQKRANEERIDANDLAKKRNLDKFTLNKDGPSTSKEAIATANSTGGAYRRVGGSNIHRLSDQHKDSDDENNTWNGNSTQQQ